MEQPLVSVVIPFYSGVSWLNKALNSVSKQNYKNIEILVINDGSKENINNIINENNLNIRIINKENGGPGSARNIGIENSNGKYIAFLDSDDLWLPEKLLKQINFMETNKYIWSQHSYEMFWENKNKSKIIDTSVYANNVYKDCFISFKVQTSCVVVLKSILFENNIRFSNKRYGEDGDFYQQIAKKYQLGYVNGIYSKFRIRGLNAGFRADIQINDRANTWLKIKQDKELSIILPRLILFAYKLSYLFSREILFLSKKLNMNDKNIELLSKFFYFLPYITFKVYSIKIHKRL